MLRKGSSLLSLFLEGRRRLSSLSMVMVGEHGFSEEEVGAYARLSGDSNPIHTEKGLAAASGFPQGCPVHGMLQASLFPHLIASHIPGARLESMSFTFRSPVIVGEILRAEAQILNVIEENQNARSNIQLNEVLEYVRKKNVKSEIISGFQSAKCTACYKTIKAPYSILRHIL